MAANDLTSLANVREAMDAASGDTSSDALISSLITRASVAIMRYAQREFAPATADATRTFEVRSRRVDLAPFDLRSAATVTFDPSGDADVLVEGTDYLLEPATAADGVYTRVRLSIDLSLYSTRARRFGWSELSIAGAWGFATVPEDVEHAAIATVLAWLRRDVEVLDLELGDTAPFGQRPQGTLGLPSAVRARLAAWRRMVAA